MGIQKTLQLVLFCACQLSVEGSIAGELDGTRPIVSSQTLARMEKTSSSVTIYRDTYGVPHVFGETDASTIFGFMYARAEDRFFKFEPHYLRLMGRSAELEGMDGLANDILVRANEFERRARAEYEGAPPEIKALCDAFADGFRGRRVVAFEVVGIA